jgi:tRNA 5-methylaminomethyl-2-thiouridine biosynthesis bifunctional protein
MPRLPPSPLLDWNDGVLRAEAFGDVYFSREGGLAEADAVFLAGCDLPQAWRSKDRFAICELGFGTGLNVLAAWRAWKKTRLPHAILHITSIEAFPLARADAARSLALFPEVADLAGRLLARWPVRAYAPQRLWFEDDGFALTLLTGEAETILADMVGQFDAWFLDGFAPARNAAMWSPGVLEQVARLSAPGARAATFTVAGDVRRGLESAGFTVEKRPGFGAKRERLEARLERPADGTHSLYPYRACRPKRVAVIGAGIAGAACAQALMRRGAETVVLEAAPEIAAGASGNPAGLVMPRLDRGDGPLNEVFLAAYLAAIEAYEALGAFDACGVEQLPDTRDAMADLLADPPLPEDWLSALPGGAALHARAGLIRPRAAIEAMLCGASVMCEASVKTIEPSGESWVIHAHDGRAMLKADAVVLACGAALSSFAPTQFLPISLSRGQIEWGEGSAPPRALTRGNYVAPFNGGVLFGATFDREIGANLEPTDEARARNLAALVKLAPDVAAALDSAKLSSRVGLRATTPDRAPIAGLLPDAEAWLAQNAVIAHGAQPPLDKAVPAHDGIYVVGGLGARGLTLAPLLGERIASEMFGEPQLLSQRADFAIHPARFLHRSLKRR